MSGRPAAMAFLEDQRSDDPVYRSIMAVDLEGSTIRTNPVKGELRRVMYDLLGHSLEASAIAGDRLEPLTDRGDGVLVLIRPHDDVPKTVLLNRLIPLLTTLLVEYNAQVSQPELRMRLRVVVHAGEVHADGRGFYGEAIDVAIRLMDSPTVKRVLREAATPVVLVVSDEIHATIIRQGYVSVDAYAPLVRVCVAGKRLRGWVHVPAPVDGNRRVVRHAAGGPRSSGLAIVGRTRTTRAGPARPTSGSGRASLDEGGGATVPAAVPGT